MNGGTAPVIVGDGIAGLTPAIQLAERGTTPVVLGKDFGGLAKATAPRDRARPGAGWLEVVDARAQSVLVRTGSDESPTL